MTTLLTGVTDTLLVEGVKIVNVIIDTTAGFGLWYPIPDNPVTVIGADATELLMVIHVVTPLLNWRAICWAKFDPLLLLIAQWMLTI
jgi:hypothetical protein